MKELKIFISLLLLTSLASCLNSYQSESLSEEIEGTAQLVDISLAHERRRLSALQVIKKRCVFCHEVSGAVPLNYQADDDFVASGLVSRGNPHDSPIYLSLIGQSLPLMPPDHPLTEEEVGDIKAWIEGMP